MNRERLLKVVEVLEGYDGELYMHSWDRCVIGICCTHDWFKERGLRMPQSWPEYNGYKDFEAVEEFFDINMHQSRYLFSSVYVSKKEHVIDNIKELLESEDAS